MNFVSPIFMSFITGVTQHLPGFAQTVNLSVTTGGLLLSAAMAGNIISKIIIGMLSDKIGALKAVIVMMLTNAISVIVMLITQSSIIMIIAAFLFGSCYSIGAVGLPLLTKYFFTNDYYDDAFPKISFASNIGAAISLSLIGYVYDFFGSYYYAFMLIIGILIVSFLLLTICQRKIEKN